MPDFLRQSITIGLTGKLVDPYTRMPIEHGLSCGCSSCGSKVTEAQLVAQPIRLPGLDKIEKSFFSETMKSVTRMEEEILEALGLPSIRKVRAAILSGERDSGEPWGGWNRDAEIKVDAAVSGHLNRFLGEPWDELKAPKKKITNPLYKYFQLQAMAESADYVESLIESAPGRPEIVLLIMPDPDMLRFLAMQEAAGTRIRTHLALQNLPELKRELEQMAFNGEWNINVARRVHNSIGEGQAWYWRRITRTESVLANNLAYDMMAEENNVLYDEWSAGPDACVVCLQFQGQVWKRGEGPVPVEDSHPNCRCYLLPQYIPGRGDVQDQWTRANPYDEPYSRDEIESIIERIGNRVTVPV